MLTIIVGLPGSGKTTLAKQIQPNSHLLDDLTSPEELRQALNNHNNVIVTSVALTKKPAQDLVNKI